MKFQPCLPHATCNINPMQVTLVTRISSQMILVTFITAPYFKIRAVQTRKRSESKWARAAGRGKREQRQQQAEGQAEQAGSYSCCCIFSLPSEAAVVPLLCLASLRSACTEQRSNLSEFCRHGGMRLASAMSCHTGAQSNSTIHTVVMFHFVSFHSVVFCGFCSRIINQIGRAQQGPLIPPCPRSPHSPLLTLPCLTITGPPLPLCLTPSLPLDL